MGDSPPSSLSYATIRSGARELFRERRGGAKKTKESTMERTTLAGSTRIQTTLENRTSIVGEREFRAMRQPQDAKSEIESELIKIMGDRQKAEDAAYRLDLAVDKFLSGEITPAMLAANPALQLLVQEGLQQRNRMSMLLSNMSREQHETMKHTIQNIRA
jgi:hypothetical protein